MDNRAAYEKIVDIRRTIAAHTPLYAICIMIMGCAATAGFYLLMPQVPHDPYSCWTDAVVEWAKNNGFECLYAADPGSGFRLIAIAIVLWLPQAIWISSAAAPIDRFLVLSGRAWLDLPTILVTGTIFVINHDFGAISTNEALILLGLHVLVVWPLWNQVGGPIIRTWMYRRANDKKRVEESERRGCLPMTLEEWRDVQIEIPPKIYVAFLVGAGALLFTILEAVLGKFLENSFGLSGYVGSSLIALCVGLIFYPVHAWTSKRVQIVRTAVIEINEGTNVTNWNQIFRKWATFHILFFVKYWYVLLCGLLAVALLAPIMTIIPK